LQKTTRASLSIRLKSPHPRVQPAQPVAPSLRRDGVADFHGAAPAGSRNSAVSWKKTLLTGK